MKRSILQMTRTSKGRKQLRPSLQVQVPEVDSRVEMIQALIPLGLRAVQEQLQQTVTEMAGARYAHDGGDVVRWGQQKGWVYLADQKVQTDVPRVRNCRLRREVPLPLYQQLQQPRLADSLAMSKVLKGLSCRDYESCVPATVETFGLSASSLSRRFKRVTARQLGQLQERDLSGYDFVALFLDGKSFAEDQMVIALGVTLRGEKVILGFVQTATENQTTCAAFLRSLVERGLRYDEGLLLVIDGAKGLRAAVKNVFGDCGVVQRCQWHKRENIVRYLPKKLQEEYRRKLQRAYEMDDYVEAKKALLAIRKELCRINESAVSSFDEGFEETLTVQKLGLSQELRRSLKTTKCIESVLSQVASKTDKVDYWKNSNQKHRWTASALLEIEPRLNKISGHRQLKTLRTALQRIVAADNKIESIKKEKEMAIA